MESQIAITQTIRAASHQPAEASLRPRSHQYVCRKTSVQ